MSNQPEGTIWQTDYKRFEEDPYSVCLNGADPNAKLYKTAPWTNYRSVYARVWELAESRAVTVKIPNDATVGQFCAFAGYGEGATDNTVLGLVDASEFWLFWSSIVILIWTYLAWRKHNSGACSVPLWYLLVLLAVGLYALFRSFGPAVTGGVTFASLSF